MNIRRVLLALSVSMLFALPVMGQTSEGDLEAVMVPLNAYLQGHATGNGAHMRQAFHPEAKLFWTTDGALNQRSSEDYIAGMSGSPARDEADRHRRVVSVEISGDIAVAKIELDYPGAFLTDYMTLIRIDGAWKIINKVFTREPARPR